MPQAHKKSSTPEPDAPPADEPDRWDQGTGGRVYLVIGGELVAQISPQGGEFGISTTVEWGFLSATTADMSTAVESVGACASMHGIESPPLPEWLQERMTQEPDAPREGISRAELIGGKVDLGDGKTRRISGTICDVEALAERLRDPAHWSNDDNIEDTPGDWPLALELTPERIAQMKEEMSDPEAYQQQAAGVPLPPYSEQGLLRSTSDSVKDWKTSDYTAMAGLFGPEVTNG